MPAGSNKRGLDRLHFARPSQKTARETSSVLLALNTEFKSLI